MTRPIRIDGFDLSNWQGHIVIDWNAAKKAGVTFCYLKATEGGGYADPDYDRRRQECYDNGVKPGAYHFARPTVSNARAEAEWFIQHATPRAGDLAPVLDLEVNTGNLTIDQLTAWVHTWFSVVFQYLGVEKGVLYTHFNLTSKPKGVVLWTARYSDYNGAPVVPHPFHTWAIWQFSDGRYGVPSYLQGVGRVDLNTLHRRFGWARLRSLLIPKRTPTARPAIYRVKEPAHPNWPRFNPANYYIGAHGPWVTWLGERLVVHGFGKHYTTGPGPTFSNADRRNVQDFQHAQGWTGPDADGFPGHETLLRLNEDPKKA